MKLLLLLLITLSFHSWGQLPPREMELPRPDSVQHWGDSIIVFVSPPEPQYPGGITALKKHTQSYEFDPIWLDSAEYKRGYVSFIVEADGSLMEIEVIRGISPELDDLMLRIVEEMPKWVPTCDQYGPVRSRVRLPITFAHREE